MNIKAALIWLGVTGALFVLSIFPLPFVMALQQEEGGLLPGTVGETYPAYRQPVSIIVDLFTLDWHTEGDGLNDELGFAVDFAGDINGDDYDDVIIGAPHDMVTQEREGVAYVYYGTPGGPGDVAAWRYGSGNKGSLFGVSVGTAGDVNADGYDDIVIGASGYANGQVNEGQVLVFFGSVEGLGMNGWTFESQQASALLGTSVRAAGDVNCDGWDDFIAGAPQYDYGETDEGAAFVFYGTTAGISTTYTILDSDQAEAEFGTSVGYAGDVNGDGCDDIVVGAPHYDVATGNEGAAFVFLGAAGGVSTSPQQILTGDLPGAQFGAAVGTAGDANFDGYDDVIIGAPGYTVDQSAEGAVFVYFGSPAGAVADAVWRGEGNKSDTAYGAALAGGGDVNDDRRGDLVIGAPRFKHETNIYGRAFVYLGTGEPLVFDKFIFLPLVMR